MTRILLAVLLLLAPAGVSAHVNDRGMDYSLYKDHRGISCCDSSDCRPAADYADTVVNGQGIVWLLIDGTWFSSSRYFVVAEDSTDGRAHWCGRMTRTRTGEHAPVIFCLILPPRGS